MLRIFPWHLSFLVGTDRVRDLSTRQIGEQYELFEHCGNTLIPSERIGVVPSLLETYRVIVSD